jgi:hypothetical protein
MIESASADHAPAERGRRYFVTIHAPDARALRALADFNLDLFQATARPAGERAGERRASMGERSDGESVAIEGLVSMDEAARLVAAGYSVTIEADEQSRTRAHETAGLQDWLAELGEV